MYEDRYYRNSFLKEVIVRIDFATPLLHLEKAMVAVAAAALQSFPIFEPRKLLIKTITVGPSPKETATQKEEEQSEWHYLGREREKRLVVASKYLHISYSTYKNFELLKAEFSEFIRLLTENTPRLCGSRIGLRYINKIEPPGHDPFIWKDLISHDLLGLFDLFANEREAVNRLLNVVEFKYRDDIQLKHIFGVPNSSYPAPLKAPLFIIDMDASLSGLIEINHIGDFLEASHSRIQGQFETSITDRLRELMR